MANKLRVFIRFCDKKTSPRRYKNFMDGRLQSPAVGQSVWPKILFIHDYRPDARLLADLVRQLFLGWPAERLVWWHCRDSELYAAPDLRAANVHRFGLPPRLVPNVRLGPAKSFLLEHFWAPRAARHLQAAIDREKPDVICVLLFGWCIPVADKIRLPAGARLHVALWDFPDTQAGQKTLGVARSQRFAEMMFELVRRADSFDGISRSVLEEIQKQTGRTDGVLVHSGFESQHLAALAQADATPDDGTIRLAYVGTIISEAGFLAMLAALKKLRTSSPKKITLEFFGGRNYRSRDWFEPEWMVEHAMFTDDGLVAALRRCAWGIVVMDPAGEDLRYSRFSFPNKVGTYLSAGVPVLCFGHPSSSLGQIMQQHCLGLFTSATDPGALEDFFRESFAIAKPRDFFCEDIRQCAQTEFNAAEMRARLWRTWGVRNG